MTIRSQVGYFKSIRYGAYVFNIHGGPTIITMYMDRDMSSINLPEKTECLIIRIRHYVSAVIVSFYSYYVSMPDPKVGTHGYSPCLLTSLHEFQK